MHYATLLGYAMIVGLVVALSHIFFYMVIYRPAIAWRLAGEAVAACCIGDGEVRFKPLRLRHVRESGSVLNIPMLRGTISYSLLFPKEQVIPPRETISIGITIAASGILAEMKLPRLMQLTPPSGFKSLMEVGGVDTESFIGYLRSTDYLSTVRWAAHRLMIGRCVTQEEVKERLIGVG